MAPAHWAQGSRVTYSVAISSRSSPTLCSARCSARSSACAVGSRRCTVSLWASPRISPSATITAPTGTSSRTEAARARRSAASIPVRSLGEGVPLRTGHRGLRGPELEAQMVAVAVLPGERPEDDDVVHPVEKLRPEVVAQLVSHLLLDPAPRLDVGRAGLDDER